jgi:hypothetical protein
VTDDLAVDDDRAPRRDSGIVPAHRRERLFLACEPGVGYFELTTACGPIEAIESEALRNAPVGALLISDSEGEADRGEVCAERVLAGWVLIPTDDATRAARSWDRGRRACCPSVRLPPTDRPTDRPSTSRAWDGSLDELLEARASCRSLDRSRAIANALRSYGHAIGSSDTTLHPRSFDRADEAATARWTNFVIAELRSGRPMREALMLANAADEHDDADVAPLNLFATEAASARGPGLLGLVTPPERLTAPLPPERIEALIPRERAAVEFAEDIYGATDLEDLDADAPPSPPARDRPARDPRPGRPTTSARARTTRPTGGGKPCASSRKGGLSRGV